MSCMEQSGWQERPGQLALENLPPSGWTQQRSGETNVEWRGGTVTGLQASSPGVWCAIPHRLLVIPWGMASPPAYPCKDRFLSSAAG
eukprot:c54407_g1_i1 orf=245-505(+)